jgi:GTPase SAR1 family protein
LPQDYEEVTEDEEEYEDDEEEEEEAPPVVQTPAAAAAAAAAAPAGPKEWVGLQSMPAQTQQSLMEALNVLRAKNQTEMTVVFVGKQGVGKSSTLNSVLNERVAQSAPFQPESLRPLLAARQAAGFTVSFLDTPGLLEGDQVSQRGLASVKLAMKDREVHAVVYMDRLDGWRVDNSDRAVFKALDEQFGRQIWERTILGFSHGQLSPPNSMKYEDYVQQRAETVRKAVRETLGDNSLVLPHAVVENGSRCATNGGGEKVLPDAARTVWLSKFVAALVDVAKKSSPIAFDPEKNYAAGTDPNKKHRLLVLPLLLIQTLLLRPLLVRQIRKDLKAGKGGRV